MAARKLDYKVNADIQQFIGQNAKVIAGFEQQIKKLQQINKVSKNTKKRFSVLSKFTPSFLSIGAAIGGIGAAFGLVNREAKASAEIIKGVRDELLALNQISGSIQEFRSDQSIATRISARFGLTEKQSLDLVVRGRQSGLSTKELFATGRLSLIDSNAVELATTLADIKLGLPSIAGDTPIDEIFEKLGVAQGPSKTTAGGLSKIALGPGKFGVKLGGSLDEILALVGLGTVGVENPQKARTQLQAFLKKLSEDEQFTTQGTLFEDVQRFVGLSKKQQAKVLGGESEAILGADTVIAQFPKLKAQIGAVSNASGFIDQKIAQTFSDPRLAAEQAARTASTRAGIARIPQGVEQLKVDAVISRASELAANQNFLSRGLLTGFLRGADLVGIGPAGVAGFATNLIGGRTASVEQKEQIATELLNAAIGASTGETFEMLNQGIGELLQETKETNKLLRQSNGNKRQVVTAPSEP